MLSTPYAVMLGVLAAELAFFGIVASRPDLSKRLSERGVTVSPFVILIDMGRVPRFRRLSSSRKFRVGALVAGLANFGVMLFLFYWQVLPALYRIISSIFVTGAPHARSPFIPVIPGVTIGIQSFIYLLLALSVGVAFHELMHAIVAYAQGWRVEAWGVGVLFIFPLAYVRPSEEDYSRAPLKAKAAVLTAGILANTILFLIAMGLTPVVTAQVHTAVTIVSLEKNPSAPAVKAGLPAPSLLVSINGTRIGSIGELQKYLYPIYPRNVTLDFRLCKAKIIGGLVKPIGPPENYIVRKPAGSKIGILVAQMPLCNTSQAALYVSRFLFWLSIVNISLSLINAAPLYISDGGKLVAEVLRGRAPGWVNHTVQGGTVVATIVLLIIGFMNFVR